MDVIFRIVGSFYVQFLKTLVLYIWRNEDPCIIIQKFRISIYVSILSPHHGFQCMHD